MVSIKISPEKNTLQKTNVVDHFSSPLVVFISVDIKKQATSYNNYTTKLLTAALTLPSLRVKYK